MNERDSEAVAAQLITQGYALAASEAEADVILLNTCSVRDSAEQKAIGKMRTLAAKSRRQRKPVVLGFIGCMAQARGSALFKEAPGVKLVLGTHKFHRVAAGLDRLAAKTEDRICDLGEEPGDGTVIRSHLLRTPGEGMVPTAFVNIMQGCNQHCTFCIVPATRGVERSRSIADIVQECRDLVAQGIREVTLLGQIVTSYGKREIGDQEGRSAFVQLLEAVHDIEGLERIRFTAPHPKGYGQDLVEAYGRLSKLCDSAHIPVQSGSNRMLKLMRRGYTVERFLDIIRELRQVRSRMSISTDIIVGFPGETEADFAATLALAQTAEFENAYLFKYSPRQDTPAASMPHQVPVLVREARHAELMKTVNELVRRKYQALVGQRLPVLVEGPSKNNPARLQGRSSCNKIVVFEGPDHWRGQIRELTITRAGSFTLYGEPLPETPASGGSLTLPVSSNQFD